MSFFKDMVEKIKDEDTTLASDGTGSAEFGSFIDSGSYILNAVLSGSLYGGVPDNKVTAFAGESATGKTYFVLGVVKSYLDRNPEAGVVYYDTEAAVTKAMMEERGIDKATSIEIHFHKKRLTEDQDVFVREGDFVLYGDRYYEIAQTSEPKQLFGQVENKFEIMAKCIRAREGMFNPQFVANTVPTTRVTTSTSTGSNSGYNPTSTGLFTNVIAENNLTVKNNTYLGDNPNDTVIITGSVYISGSLLVNGSTFSLSSSAVSNKTILITSSYAVQSDDYFIGVDTNYTGIVITLPSLASTTNGRILHIKDEKGFADVGLEVTVSASSGDLVDDVPYVVIDVDHGSLSLYKSTNGWNLF